MWSLLISTSLGWVGTKKIGEWRKKAQQTEQLARGRFPIFSYMPETAASSSPETGKWARGNSRLFHFMLVPIERRPLIMVSSLLACCVLLGFFFGLVVPDFNWVSFSFSLSCSRMVQFTQHTGKVLRLWTMNVYRCYRLGLDLSQKVNSFFSVSQHWAALVSTSFNLFSALSSLRFFSISVHKRGELWRWRMKNVNSLVVCSSEPQQTDDDGSVKMNAR